MQIIFNYLLPVVTGILLAIYCKKIWQGIIIIIIFYGGIYLEYKFLTKPEIKKALEYAYSEGQIDYSNDDIRIKKIDSTYIWVRSPWNDGKEPTYNFESIDK